MLAWLLAAQAALNNFCSQLLYACATLAAKKCFYSCRIVGCCSAATLSCMLIRGLVSRILVGDNIICVWAEGLLDAVA
jgi:hypothetical protein